MCGFKTTTLYRQGKLLVEQPLTSDTDPLVYIERFFFAIPTIWLPGPVSGDTDILPLCWQSSPGSGCWIDYCLLLLFRHSANICYRWDSLVYGPSGKAASCDQDHRRHLHHSKLSLANSVQEQREQRKCAKSWCVVWKCWSCVLIRRKKCWGCS